MKASAENLRKNEMNGKKRLPAFRPSYIFIIASLICFLIVFLCFLFSAGDRINQYFFYNVRDTGMDFFHSAEYLEYNQPYVRFGTLYPPLANLFFALINRMMPDSTSDSSVVNYKTSLRRVATTTDLRTFQAPMLMFILFIILSVFFIVAIISKALEKHDERTKWGVTLSCLLSYCMLFAFERGNIIVISWIFTMSFLLTFDHINTVVREMGLVALAIAAGLKIYPALYGLILLRERRYGAALRCICYGLLAIILPVFFFEEGLHGLSIWFEILTRGERSTIGTAPFRYDLLSLLQALRSDFRLFYGFELSAAALWVFWSIILLCVFISAFICREKWKCLCYISLAFLLFSSQSGYGLIWFLIPMIAFIREEDHIARSNVVLFASMSLLTLNIPIFEDQTIGNTHQLYYHIIFGVLIFQAMVDMLVSIKEKVKHTVKEE